MLNNNIKHSNTSLAIIRNRSAFLSIPIVMGLVLVSTAVTIGFRQAVVAHGKHAIKHLNSAEGFYATEAASIRGILDLQEYTRDGQGTYVAWLSDISPVSPTSTNKVYRMVAAEKTIRRYTGNNLTFSAPQPVNNDPNVVGYDDQKFCTEISYDKNGKAKSNCIKPNLCHTGVLGGMINFEKVSGATPAEGVAIAEQYVASHGIRFCVDGNADGICNTYDSSPTPNPSDVPYAVIAKKGWAPDPGAGIGQLQGGVGGALAFTCLAGLCAGGVEDSLHNHFDPFVGDYFLTDDRFFNRNKDIIVQYVTPTSEISGQFLDIEDESLEVTLRTTRSGPDLETLQIPFGSPNTGDGRLAPWAIRRPTADIGWVRLRNKRSTGIALDNFAPRAYCFPKDPATTSAFFSNIGGGINSGGTTRTGAAIEQTPGFVADGVFVGGDFTSFKGTARNRIARINKDGSLDLSFDPGSGFNGAVNDIKVTYDSQAASTQMRPLSIVVVGNFTQYNGATANGIIELNLNGSSNADDFVTGTGFTGQPGKIEFVHGTNTDRYVGGAFSAYKGVSRGGIVRLLANGVDDTPTAMQVGFKTGSSAGGVAAMLSIDETTTNTPNFALYVGGTFDKYGTTAVSRLVRLNSAGSLDVSFAAAIGSGPNDVVMDIKPTYDGSGDIYVAGNFTQFNGVPASRLIRLRRNGTINPILNVGAGFNGYVRAVMPVADGSKKLYVAGAFSTYQGYSAPALARINADGSLDSEFQVAVYGPYTGEAWWLAPASDSFSDIYSGAQAGGTFTYGGVTAITPGIARFRSNVILR